MIRSKLTAAAAGILRDNHLLITGLWQGLTKLTDSQVPITLAICHLFGCPGPESLSHLQRLCGRQSWPDIIDTGKRQTLFHPASLEVTRTGAGQLAAPARDVKPLPRCAEKEKRGGRSRKVAVAADGKVQVQADHTGEAAVSFLTGFCGLILPVFSLSSLPLFSRFLTLFFCTTGDSVGFLLVFL